MLQKHVDFPVQRGESRIGCIVGIMILSILFAISLRIFPIYNSNNRFFEAVEDIATRSGNMSRETIEAEIAKKAKDLKIPEALAPGAISVSCVIAEVNGMCTVRIKYARKVKLFGITILVMNTDRDIAKSITITGI